MLTRIYNWIYLNNILLYHIMNTVLIDKLSNFFTFHLVKNFGKYNFYSALKIEYGQGPDLQTILHIKFLR